MLTIICSVLLCFGFSIMAYDSFKKGSKLLGCLGIFVVAVNLLDIASIIILGGN